MPVTAAKDSFAKCLARLRARDDTVGRELFERLACHLIACRRSRQRGWPWAVVTRAITVFTIALSRTGSVARRLVDPSAGQVITTDRYKGYLWLRLRQRQICWAHLSRDCQAMVDRGNAGRAIGEQLLCCTQDLFTWWYRVRDGTLSRSTFRQYMGVVRSMVREALDPVGVPEGAKQQPLGAEFPDLARTCARRGQVAAVRAEGEQAHSGLVAEVRPPVRGIDRGRRREAYRRRRRPGRRGPRAAARPAGQTPGEWATTATAGRPASLVAGRPSGRGWGRSRCASIGRGAYGRRSPWSSSIPRACSCWDTTDPQSMGARPTGGRSGLGW
jgi:hypothetical protein